MAESITVQLPQAGDVLIERSYRAKHVRLSFRPPSNVRIAVPLGISFKVAQKFAKEKESWIVKQISKYADLDMPALYQTAYPFSRDLLINRSDYFINRVKYLASKYKFQHNKISIKMMKSRWGSCSYKNNISINILIDYLPKKLQDYVILHELMHTKIKNHSKNFWSELEHIVKDLDSIRKELKENYIL